MSRYDCTGANLVQFLNIVENYCFCCSFENTVKNKGNLTTGYFLLIFSEFSFEIFVKMAEIQKYRLLKKFCILRILLATNPNFAEKKTDRKIIQSSSSSFKLYRAYN